MRVVFSNQDLDGLCRVAARYYGVLLTRVQARKVLRSKHADEVVREFFVCGGVQDTAAREDVIDCLVRIATDGFPPPGRVDRPVGYDYPDWHWPCNGSSPAYAREFYAVFWPACKAQGWGVVDDGVGA